jgi:hypothetical protein
MVFTAVDISWLISCRVGKGLLILHLLQNFQWGNLNFNFGAIFEIQNREFQQTVAICICT